MQVKVHFQLIKDEIIKNIKNAQNEIKVAVAWLTDEDIIRTLGQKSSFGIDVKIVISDSKENFKNTVKLNELVRNQSQLYVVSPKFMHHKFCIIDNSLIINGSYNWTYSAKSNEENILVIKLDNELKEDSELLLKFNTKFNFLCDKVSIKIVDNKILNDFKSSGKDATILAQLDENEIVLRQELEDDVKKSFQTAESIKISISPLLFERMKSDGGGVEFIKRIIHDEIKTGEMKSGFKKLEENIPNRVDLSLEFLVSRPKYECLFTIEEVEFCKKLMRKYNL